MRKLVLTPDAIPLAIDINGQLARTLKQSGLKELTPDKNLDFVRGLAAAGVDIAEVLFELLSRSHRVVITTAKVGR